jgi:hypothetical protein
VLFSSSSVAQMAESGESDGLSLILTVPSPTEDSGMEEDSGREFVIWVDDTGTPSIGYKSIFFGASVSQILVRQLRSSNRLG